MKITALVPVKDHSERLPNKNFLPFAGKPLYRWILESLQPIKAISEIIINTDSPRLLNIKFDLSKVKVVKRDSGVCGDDVSMNRVIESTLPYVQNEYLLQTHTTNPLLKTQTISKAIRTYSEKVNQGYDSLFSVTPLYKRFYYQGKPINHDPKKLINTQDLEPILEENSNMYIFSKNSFNNNCQRIGKHPFLYTQDSIEAIDIDTIDEFHIAESQVKNFQYL